MPSASDLAQLNENVSQFCQDFSTQLNFSKQSQVFSAKRNEVLFYGSAEGRIPSEACRAMISLTSASVRWVLFPKFPQPHHNHLL